jgi:hypothetical protein
MKMNKESLESALEQESALKEFLKTAPKVKVSDYYKDELFRFMPEEMFALLDEAYFHKQKEVWIPDILLDEFENNKSENQPK